MLFIAVPWVAIVMICFVPPYVTDMLAVNPPPVTERFMRPSASRPVTSPAALKVRSSQVPGQMFGALAKLATDFDFIAAVLASQHDP